MNQSNIYLLFGVMLYLQYTFIIHMYSYHFHIKILGRFVFQESTISDLTDHLCCVCVVALNRMLDFMVSVHSA